MPKEYIEVQVPIDRGEGRFVYPTHLEIPAGQSLTFEFVCGIASRFWNFINHDELLVTGDDKTGWHLSPKIEWWRRQKRAFIPRAIRNQQRVEA